ncbi:uncharacterized protein NPIL_122191 [Nephila pilipes]|uniref:Gustatory receptor n=1 Tax=Nephila pilipes TaxID=299642 RepID=A0A8X6TRC0_NEPPI|nr:uncharacterized protein NPIL_122191 [Nephila pilipes]
MCPLVFVSSIYNASVVYFGLTAALHHEEYIDGFQIMSVCSIFTANFVAYIGLTLSASLVHESSEDLLQKAYEVLNFRNDINSIQQRFLSSLEKDLFLTVWRIVPIKRSFIFTTMGTIFTYCIILDSLRPTAIIVPEWRKFVL